MSNEMQQVWCRNVQEGSRAYVHVVNLIRKPAWTSTMEDVAVVGNHWYAGPLATALLLVSPLLDDDDDRELRVQASPSSTIRTALNFMLLLLLLLLALFNAVSNSWSVVTVMVSPSLSV